MRKGSGQLPERRDRVRIRGRGVQPIARACGSRKPARPAFHTCAKYLPHDRLGFALFRRIGDRGPRIAGAPSAHHGARIRPPAPCGYPAGFGSSETDQASGRIASPIHWRGSSGAGRCGVVRSRPMQEFREKKVRGDRITALTAYDYPTARLLDESGIDIILVGDSLGMVVLGYEDTTQVTLAEMVHHTKAVARGVERALLVADFPIHTYDNPAEAVATAHALVEAGAQAVKLEGGISHVPQIEAIIAKG